MPNPYRAFTSAFDDNSPPPNLPTGIPGFPLRHSSYAIAAGGMGSRSGSRATFANLLNPVNSADGSDTNGLSSIGTSNVRNTYNNNNNNNNNEIDAMRSSTDSDDGGFLQWPGSRNTTLPSFSRAFEPYLRGPVHDGFGPIPSNKEFFTPSYLRESVHVQKLENQYRAKMQALRETQQLQQHQQHPASTSPASAATTAAAAAAAAASGMSVPSLTGSSGLVNSSLVSRSSSHNLHGSIGIGSGGGSGSGSGSGTGSSAKPEGSFGASNGAGYSKGSKSRGGAGGIGAAGASGLAAGLADEETVAPLPTRWDKQDKAANLEVLADGLDVKLTAPKSSSDRDQDACSIRADHYMPPQCGIYYFEITILTKKRDEATIGIGFSDVSASLSRPPGWEPKSWGYHSDDGNVFASKNVGKQFGPCFNSGDVVGCGVNFRLGTAFFTKNGNHLGTAFRDIRGSNLKLFPMVGMKKTGEHIRVNFGQVPFTFDIDGMMKKERLAIKRQISETSTDKLAPPLTEPELLQQLVLQFLQHDGYVDAAKAFAEEIQEQKQALSIDPEEPVKEISIADDEDANNRQRIRRSVLEGDIDRALKLTNAYYPQVLKDNEEVFFRLRCRKFIEMIRQEAELNLVGSPSEGNGLPRASTDDNKQSNGHGENNGQQTQQDMDVDDVVMVEDGTDNHPESQSLVDEAIAYGQALQSEYVDDSRTWVRSALNEIFSLLAYSNPLKEKEVAHLLDQEGRVLVAEELNSAILESLGKSSRSALENLYAQTSVLLDDLRQDGGPGSFVTIGGIVEQIR